MNCLTEALGLSLPGNGSTLATHAARRELFLRGRPHRRRPGPALVRRRRRRRCCPAASPPGTRSRTRWRSTSRWAARPTPCCTSWPPPRRREVDFDLRRHRRDLPPGAVPVQGGAEHADYHMEDVHRAGGIPAILGELRPGGLLNQRRAHRALPIAARRGSTVGRPRRRRRRRRRVELFHAAPGRRAHHRGLLDGQPLVDAWTPTPPSGCIRDVAHAYTVDGGLAVLHGNIAPDGAVIKTAGIAEELWHFAGPARVVESPGGGRLGHPRRDGPARRRHRGPLRGPARRPGDAGDAAPHRVPQGRAAWQGVRADHRRPVLRRHLGRRRSGTSRPRPRRAA